MASVSKVSPAYLAGDRWQRLRRKALQHAEWRCQVCNGEIALDVHHRTYARVGTPDEVLDLIVLCGFCHALFHQTLVKRAVRSLWEKLYARVQRRS